MFNRVHHQRIATILGKLDGDFLRKNACYFGGGTAIALRFDEYRESIDIDFLTSDVSSYRNLRSLIRESNSLKPLLLNKSSDLRLASDIRADQYGIRTKVLINDVSVKFEIILEARVVFDIPTKKEIICNITTLALHDLATSKILANSDRGLDNATFTRDIIDLAMMDLPVPLLKKALQKASGAYGASALADLQKVFTRLEENPELLKNNMQKMNITLPQAFVWQKLRKLKKLFV